MLFIPEFFCVITGFFLAWGTWFCFLVRLVPERSSINLSLSLSHSSAAAAQGCQFISTLPPQEHLALNLEFWRCVLCRGFVERGALLSLLLPCVNLVQLKFFLSCSFSSSTTELLCHLSKKSACFPQVLFFRVWHLTSFQHFLFSLED